VYTCRVTDQNFAVFDTAMGACALAWSERGIAGVQLPGKDDAATRSQMLRRFRGACELAPPPSILRVIGDIAAMLHGERRDFADVALDQSVVSEFNRRVYAVVRAIPWGATMSYGEVAERLGNVALAREVGRAMGANPTPIIVPCHRVLAARGKVGGFSAPGGVATKLRLLKLEGTHPCGGPTLFDHLPRMTAPLRRV